MKKKFLIFLTISNINYFVSYFNNSHKSKIQFKEDIEEKSNKGIIILGVILVGVLGGLAYDYKYKKFIFKDRKLEDVGESLSDDDNNEYSIDIKGAKRLANTAKKRLIETSKNINNNETVVKTKQKITEGINVVRGKLTK
jgi:hypothetical protein